MSDRVSILIAICLACSSIGWVGSPKTSLAVTLPLTLAQTPAASEANPAPDLKPGSEGKEVRVIQHLLKELGYFQGPLDGQYGAGTQTAISKFQERQGLAATGIADAKTREQLKASYAQKQPSPGGEKSDGAKKPKKGKLPFTKERLILLLGGFVTLALGGVGLFLLLRAFNNAMPSAASIPPNFPEDDDGERISEDIYLTPSEPLPPPQPHSEANEPRESLELPQTTAERPQQTGQSETPKNKRKEPLKAQPNSAKSLAVKPLSRLPKLDPIEELIKDLQKPSSEIRGKAIWELAQRADSRAVQPLIGLLIDSDSQQRGLILEALAQIGTRTLKPMNRALTIALQDDNAQVRKNAIRDLTQMYELVAKLSKLLYLAADDPDPEVQETARWALNQLNSIQMPNVSEDSNSE